MIHAYAEEWWLYRLFQIRATLLAAPKDGSEKSGETWRVVAGGGGGNHHAQGVGLMHPRGSLYVVERVVR